MNHRFPRFRRSQDGSPRVEMVPLIDVIFLVLTFFIYAMVLLIPAKVLPMRLHAFEAGCAGGEPAPAVTISITKQGELAVDREPVELHQLAERIRTALGDQPGGLVYIAAEEIDTYNQYPVLIEIYRRLQNEDVQIAIVGRPGEGGE